MNTLKIDGSSVEYTEELAAGIYKVVDNEAVQRNCRALKIDMDIPTHDNEVNERVTKIGGFGILSFFGNDTYMQFIFSTDASVHDFEFMLNVMPERSHMSFMTAFDATRPHMPGKEA